MSQKDELLQVSGKVIDALPGLTFRVELPNGHVVLAHVAKKQRATLAPISVGDSVRLEMSSYDLNEGRIVVG